MKKFILKVGRNLIPTKQYLYIAMAALMAYPSAGYSQASTQVIQAGAADGIVAPTNYVMNQTFDRNVNSILSSGLATPTVATSGADLIKGKGSLSWLSGAIGEYIKVLAATPQNDLKGKFCMAYFQYQYATLSGANNFTFKSYVEDSSGTKISSEVLLAATYDSLGVNTGATNFAVIPNFPCNTTNGSRVVVERTVAATTLFAMDEVFLVEYKGTTVPDGASFFGGAEQFGAGSCTYAESTSSGGTNFVALGTGSGCLAWSVTGRVVSTATNDHRIALVTPGPGVYQVEITGGFWLQAAGTCIFRLSDGTNTWQPQVIFGQVATALETNVLKFAVTVSQQQSSNLTLTLQAADTQATGCAVDNTNAGAMMSWKVYRFPANNLAYSNVMTAQNWNFDWRNCPGTITATWTTNANVTCKWKRQGGDAFFDVNVNTTGVPSPSVSLVLTLWAGIAFDTSRMTAGSNDAQLFMGASGSVIDTAVNTYGAVPILNTTTSFRPILWGAGGTYTAAGSVNVTTPHSFGSGDTINLKFSVPLTENGIPWTETYNALQLAGSFTSGNTFTAYKHEFGLITGGAYPTNCTTNPCTVMDNSAPFTVGRTSAGIYTITFPTGTWTGANYVCTHSLLNYVGSPSICYFGTRTQTTTGITCTTAAGAANDVAMAIDCKGPR